VGLLPPPPPPLPAVGVAGRGERERRAEAVEVGTAGVPVAPAAEGLGEELLPLLPVAAAVVEVAGAEAEAVLAGEGCQRQQTLRQRQRLWELLGCYCQLRCHCLHCCHWLPAHQ
jgi:hypothetical protein